MNPVLLVASAQCALLVAVVLLRDPRLLIPAVVLGLPMEVFETETLGTLGQGGLLGAVRSLLNPGQAAIVVTILVAAFRARHSPGRLIPNSSLVIPLATLVLVEFLGVAWSDSLVPARSIIILPMYLAFVFVAPTLIEDRKDIDRIVVAFLAAAAGLALIAIAQRLLGVFNWRGVLIQSDAYSYRSNATFADPNILARFLALSMALGAGMILATGPRRTTIYLAVPALVFGAAGIIATASRSGWLALVFCGFVVVLAAPIARYTKARLTIGVFGALAAFLVFVLLQGGTDAERVRSLSQGLSVIGQRDFLIKAGWAMFKDSPVVGVGAGNYQHSLVVTYFYLVPDWAKTTLSHTSLISLVAELGLLGVFLFLFVVVRLAVTVVRTYYATKVTFNRVMVGWIGAGLLTVFLHSQSEGRFLEEPFLWVLLALLVAFETRPALAGRGAADLPERSQAVVPSARAGTIPADALGAAGGG